jgi:hypothetical protein
MNTAHWTGLAVIDRIQHGPELVGEFRDGGILENSIGRSGHSFDRKS